jgi:hypothetical protein
VDVRRLRDADDHGRDPRLLDGDTGWQSCRLVEPRGHHSWRFRLFNAIFGLLAIALAALEPLLRWGMRRHEPDSRRRWVVLLVGLATGYVVLIHRGITSGLAAWAVERSNFRCRGCSQVTRPLTFWLYYEFTWFSTLAGSNCTGTVGQL